jgi:putative transposase
LTAGEIAAHFEEAYQATVSREHHQPDHGERRRGAGEWSARPGDPIHPVIFVDATAGQGRGSQVRSTPFSVDRGDTPIGAEILAIRAGDGGRRRPVLAPGLPRLAEPGRGNVPVAVGDRLEGLPEAITTFRERTAVQQCITHLIRNSFHEAGRQHRDGIVNALKPVYTATSGQAEKERFNEFKAERGQQYAAIGPLCESSWAESVPSWDTTWRIRPVMCSTNAIEPVGARYRRAVRARGYFPNETPGAEMLLPGHESA